MPLRPLTEYNTGGIETAMTRFQYGHAGHERGQYLWQVIMMHAWGQVSAVAAASSLGGRLRTEMVENIYVRPLAMK